MASVKKAIKIFARLKPSSESSSCQYEIDKHVNDDGSTDDILILNTSNSMNTINNNSQDDYQDHPASVANRADSHKFRFSKVFDDSSSQEFVFSEICQPVLESALQGYNSTIFAYGQTGSGKTYTMTGSRQQWNNRGIIPRSLSYIFEKFNDLTEQGYIASAFLSYLEIYNENGYDLLHTGFSSGRIEDLKKVQLLEDSQQQIHMRNLTVHPIKSEDEAMQLLYLGDHNRIIAETPMNEASTRSHCIFTIHLNIREGNSSTVRRSKVHLVDLAGSERLANSQSTGQLFHEARHINLALHYLEQVIVALGEAHRSHIPYRNSMMTSILRDSLGGNCMTSMVATLSLEHRNVMETLSTCRFSQRVALVTNAAMLNEETDPMLLIAQLKAENKRLKDIIANSSIKTIESCSNPLSQDDVAECWKLVEKFVTDADEEAILPVLPDMRLVQTCFRCLKMAVQMNKEDLLGISPAMALVSVGNGSARTVPEQKYKNELTRDQLLECLRIRDAEIDVLKKMLKPSNNGNSNNRNKLSSFFQGSASNGSAPVGYEYGDGPEPQDSRLLSPFVDDEFDSKTHHGSGNMHHESLRDHPEDGMPNASLLNFIGSTEPSDQNSPTDQDLFPENLFIEGFTDQKRQALDSFKRSYKGAEKMINLRKTLSSKRNEVDSIETLLRRNHANLKNLKVVLMSSDGGGEEEDLFMKEAVQSQTQSIQKQEKQLMKTKEELKQVEETLKSLYAQFFSEFEKQWISMKEFRERSRIPSDIDLFMGVDGTIERGKGSELESPKSGKQFSEVTKGVIKGLGGVSPRYRKSAQTRNSAGRNQLIDGPSVPPQTRHSFPPIAHLSKSYSQPPMPGNPTSARKSISSTKGKQTPTNSPRTEKSTPDSRSPRNKANTTHMPYTKPAQYQKTFRHPPASPPTPLPATASTSAPPVQLLHHHNYNEFPSEVSTDNFVGYYRQPKQYEEGEQSHPGVDYEKDDEELIKDLPMTGDASVDQEILSFFTRRQAIFRQINGDGKPDGGAVSSNMNSALNNPGVFISQSGHQRQDGRSNNQFATSL